MKEEEEEGDRPIDMRSVNTRMDRLRVHDGEGNRYQEAVRLSEIIRYQPAAEDCRAHTGAGVEARELYEVRWQPVPLPFVTGERVRRLRQDDDITRGRAHEQDRLQIPCRQDA